MNNLNFNTEEFPLDNAAKIYPAAKTKKWNAVFGVSVFIKENVNEAALEKSAQELSARFPFYYVALKRGFLWDSFIPAENCSVVEKEHSCPCRPFNLKDKSRPLFRIVYSGREIRAEFFHSVTDGTGAFEYLKALILRYYENQNCSFDDTGEIKTVNQSFKAEEIRDDFLRVYKKGEKSSRKEKSAYQLPIKPKSNYLSSTKICLPVDTVKKIAKTKYNCTVTQYTAAVYALAILEKYKQSASKKPVKISVPVNLRPYFNSQTLRNFSSFININVTPKKEYSFEAVLELIKSEMSKK
ncbi:MAG: hypothetical protein LUG21_07985 [Clostridiales bacterium]|nr:hypothetical protein [Clostridiales bacterium]